MPKKMLDGVMRRLIDPPLDRLAPLLVRAGIGADAVTALGILAGLTAAAAIAFHLFWLGLVLILVSRLADGLDGAVARATRKTDFGGYFDIAADFLFYGAVPFAFVLADPGGNGLAGAFLLLSFYFNGSTFLGYAVLAERQKLSTERRGEKTIYFTDGLLEGTETVALFVAFCLFPALFAPLAWAFGALTFVTGLIRVWRAWRLFGGR